MAADLQNDALEDCPTTFAGQSARERQRLRDERQRLRGERVVRHRLRIDVEAEASIPLDDDTIGRDLADDATVAGTKAGVGVVVIEHDSRSDAHTCPKAGCKVTGSNTVHALSFGRIASPSIPQSRQERNPRRRMARGAGGRVPNSTA